MYVVEHHRLSVTRRFCQTDVTRDNRFEHLRSKETFQVGSNLFRESSSVVIHSEENAFDGEGWINSAAEAHQGVEKL